MHVPRKCGPWGRMIGGMLGATAGKCTRCPGRKEYKVAHKVPWQGQRSGTRGMGVAGRHWVAEARTDEGGAGC